MKPVTRLLVIRFSSIGDIVLTTPVLRALKNQLDGATEVHFLTKKKFADVLEGNPNIDRVHVMEKSVQEILPELEIIGFDYVIDLHNNIRSHVVIRRLKVLAFTFKKHNFEKWLWVNTGINRMPDIHIVDRYMACLKAFSAKDDGSGLDFFIADKKGLTTDMLPAHFSDGYVAVSIGGAHEGKKMSAAKMAGICKNITHPIVLIGGQEDAASAQTIVKECGNNVFNACGIWTLQQSADAVRKARLLVTGDTGMMHIASAFGKKILSLWGCTVPGFGMYPYRPHPASILLEPVGRKKRPCSKLGNRCKYGMDHKCIDQISDDVVLSAIEKLWAQ